MKKVILIDDEPLARNLIKEYLQSHAELNIIAECENGFEGIKAIAQHKPDLIFLDIQMPKINGFEMLELLTETPSVIFTTAFDQYALKAFDTQAIDYLLKPFSQERFDLAIQKWKSQQARDSYPRNLENTPNKFPEEKNRIVVKQGNEIKIIPTLEVFLLEANDDWINIYTKDQVYAKKKTLNYYEQTLDPGQFIRPHRSFMFNIKYLTRIETLEKNSYLGFLTNGLKVPISRNSYGTLKEILGI